MKSNKNIWVWLLITSFAIVVIFLLLSSKKAVDWRARYNINIEDPYGLSILRELVADQYGVADFQVIEKPFSELSENLDHDERYTYIFIGHDRNYAAVDIAAILQFVENGNQFFLCAESINGKLMDTLASHFSPTWKSIDEKSVEGAPEEDLSDTIYDSLWDDEWIVQIDSSYIVEGTDMGYLDDKYAKSVVLNFSQNELCRDLPYSLHHFYRKDTIPTWWNYFSPEYIAEVDGLEILGVTDDSLPNIIRISHGNGNFLFHTVPLAFTNVELLDEDRLEYAEKTFLLLKENKILWDEYEYTGDVVINRRHSKSSNPLSYILTEPPLKWSIYLILAGSCLFILFRAKRRQQFIPVLKPNVNTSLEYVQMMGQLVYAQRDHQYISIELWRQFIDYIRSYYYIGTAELNDDWVTKLSVKSKVEPNRIKGIKRAYDQTGRETCKEEDLLNLYRKLKYFYAHCK